MLGHWAGDIATQLKQFRNNILPYWRILCEHDDRLSDNAELEEIDFEDSDNSVRLIVEINDACNCHPEYIDYGFEVTYSELNMSLNDFEAMVFVKKEKARQEKKQKAKEKKRQLEEERAMLERVQWENLKKKYGEH